MKPTVSPFSLLCSFLPYLPLKPIDDFLMIMLRTHCVHPLCNLLPFPSVKARSFEDRPESRSGRPFYLGLHPQAFLLSKCFANYNVFHCLSFIKTACLAFSMSLFCPRQLHCSLLFLPFYFPPFAPSMPLMRSFNIFA